MADFRLQNEANPFAPATAAPPPPTNPFSADPFMEISSQPPPRPPTTGGLDTTPDILMFPRAPATTAKQQPTHDVSFFDGPPNTTNHSQHLPGPGPAPIATPAAQPPVTATPTVGQDASCFSFEYYQYFFDVDTSDVAQRIKSTVMLHRPPDFLQGKGWHYGHIPNAEEDMEVVAKKADLYGPFWIVTTLWICLAIVGNLLNKIHFERTKDAKSTDTWGYDFTKAIVAASVTYSFAIVLPMSFWALAKFRGVSVSLLDAICVYGYSMDYFIVACILCAIPNDVLQYIVCFICGALSATFIVVNLWTMLSSGFSKQMFVGVVAGVVVSHLVLTLVFKFYFFAF